MSTELALQAADPSKLTQHAEFSAFGNISHFENAQRMAKALCSSSIVPDNYRGEQNLGSCVIALEISNRIGASVLAVMQNLYVIHGKPGWSSQFLISCVNASRKFSPLRYRMTGTKGQDDWGCIAWATDRTNEVLESPEVTISMAKAEGWYQKNGSKWKTMPELMLRYRTATLFARLYAPELTMGIQTTDEIQDFVDVESTVVPTVAKTPQFPGPPPALLEAPKPEPRKRKEKAIAPEPPADGDLGPAPEIAPAVKTEDLPLPEPTPEKSFEEVVDGEKSEVVELTAAIKTMGARLGYTDTEALQRTLKVIGNRKLFVDLPENRRPTLYDVNPAKYSILSKNIGNGALDAEIKGVVL